MENFADAILAGSELRNSLEETIENMEVIERLLEITWKKKGAGIN